MDTSNCTSYLYKDNNGRFWDFFMTDGSLFYNIDDHGKFYESTKLLDDVKLFDITGDKNAIYIVCLTLKEELAYLTYTNNEWKKDHIEITNNHSTIRKIHVYVINDIVHIFYESLNDGTRRPKLYHLHLVANNWVCNTLNTNSISTIHHYFIDNYNNGDIIVFYYSLMKNKLWLHGIVFSHENRTWSKGKYISSTEIDMNITNLFIDSKNQLHILYHHGTKVYWKKFNIIIYTPFIKLELLDKSILMEDTLNLSYLFFEYAKRLWISWEISNEIYFLTNDNSRTWTTYPPLLVDDCHIIKYISYPNEAYPLAKAFMTYTLKTKDKSFILGLDPIFNAAEKKDDTKQSINNDWVVEHKTQDEVLVEDTNVEDNVTEDNNKLNSSEELIANNDSLEHLTEIDQEDIITDDSISILDKDINTIDSSQLLTSKSRETFINRIKKQVESYIESIKNLFTEE